MGLEKGAGYSRKAYEDTEAGITDIARSVDASAPTSELREKLGQQEALIGHKEALHAEANEQAIAEDTARSEQAEAADLLKKMHENAGITKEIPVDARSPEKRQEAPAARESAPSPDQEMKKLYDSLDLAKDGKDGEVVFHSRKSVEENSYANIESKIEVGLAAEESHDEEKRGSFFKRAVMAGGAGAAVGIGGVTFLGTTAATLGFATGGVALGVGVLGWAGMKAYHAWKERKHRKTFDKLRHG